MEHHVIKHDLKSRINLTSYYAETEFYRLLNDNSIPHEARLFEMEKQITIITNAFNGLKLIDAFLPDAQPAAPAPAPTE